MTVNANIVSSSINDIGKFLSTIASNSAAPASVKTALADLTTAAHSVEAAVPDAVTLLVNTEINALLAKIPGLNLADTEIDALADDVIELVVNFVLAKLGITAPVQTNAAAPAASTAEGQAAAVSTLESGQG